MRGGGAPVVPPVAGWNKQGGEAVDQQGPLRRPAGRGNRRPRPNRVGEAMDIGATIIATRARAAPASRNAVVAAGCCALTFAVLACAPESRAQAEVFRVDPEGSRAEFSVGHGDRVSFRGAFRAMWGTIRLDRSEKALGVDFIVDARSVATGWQVRDAFIRSEFVFDSGRHPAMRFASRHAGFDGGRLAEIGGELTLRGVTRDVRLEVTRFACGTPPDSADRCAAHVRTRVRRSDFGVDVATDLVGDDVELEFDLAADRVRAAEIAP